MNVSERDGELDRQRQQRQRGDPSPPPEPVHPQPQNPAEKSSLPSATECDVITLVKQTCRELGAVINRRCTAATHKQGDRSLLSRRT
jgi:hypothetical protein